MEDMAFMMERKSGRKSLRAPNGCSAQFRSTAEHEVGRRGRLRPVLTERSTIHPTAETAGSTI